MLLVYGPVTRYKQKLIRYVGTIAALFTDVDVLLSNGAAANKGWTVFSVFFCQPLRFSLL